MLVDYMELYLTNDKIRNYVDRYMKAHRILYVDAALKVRIVRDCIDDFVQRDRK